MKKAKYYLKKDNKVICYLCPHTCSLKEEERGKCKVRKNVKGELFSTVYGKPTSEGIDPIEKKPLYHFLPGEKAFSIGTAGCNQSCLFCCNWQISQSTEKEIRTMDLSPEEAVKKAESRNSKIIAYTYNEPTVFIEYMQETAEIAREKNLKNIAVTCGLVNEKPLRDISKFLDAANIDLKYFSDQKYKEVSGGRLEPVLNTIKTLKEEGVWIEITNLIIPGLNDDEETIRKMCKWIIDNIGDETPLHFSRFYPTYKMNKKPPTPIETVKKAEKIAKEEGIKYVYIGNIPEETPNTNCSNCDATIIERKGFKSKIKKLDQEKGECIECGEKIPGIWK